MRNVLFKRFLPALIFALAANAATWLSYLFARWLYSGADVYTESFNNRFTFLDANYAAGIIALLVFFVCLVTWPRALKRFYKTTPFLSVAAGASFGWFFSSALTRVIPSLSSPDNKFSLFFSTILFIPLLVICMAVGIGLWLYWQKRHPQKFWMRSFEQGVGVLLISSAASLLIFSCLLVFNGGLGFFLNLLGPAIGGLSFGVLFLSRYVGWIVFPLLALASFLAAKLGKPLTESAGEENESVSPRKKMRSFAYTVLILGALLFLYSNSFMRSSRQQATQKLPESTATQILPSPPESQPETRSDWNIFARWESGKVVLKENSSSKDVLDVYLSDDAGHQNFFMSLGSILKDHYHFAEAHNGNLYVIRRVANYAKKAPQDWTDELWRYDGQGGALLLFTLKGLDFRVSEDEKYIAVVGGEAENKDSVLVTFLNADGRVLSLMKAGPLFQKVPQDLVSAESWAKDRFWVQIGTEKVLALAQINPENLDVLSFDLSTLPINKEDFALNAAEMKIAYSDSPLVFDTEEAKQYKNTPVHLYVMDLKSRKQQMIATSKGRSFNPIWRGKELEYNNPEGKGSLIWKLP